MATARMRRSSGRGPETLGITIDSNEQRPLLFPRYLSLTHTTVEIVLERRRMEWGDYGPTGHLDLVGVERKYSVGELEDNFNGAVRRKGRAKRAFRRMAECCRHRYLLLDMSISALFPRGLSASSYVLPLCHLLCGYDFRLMGPMQVRTPTARRRAGEMVATLFYAHLHPSEEWDMGGIVGGWSDVEGVEGEGGGKSSDISLTPTPPSAILP